MRLIRSTFTIRTLADAWPALRRAARLSLGGWADMLAPRLCALCALALPAGQRGLCSACCAALPGRTAARCPVCALALTACATPRGSPATTAPPACVDCALRTPAFDAAFALGDYAAPLERALIVAKFHGQWPLLRALGQALADDVKRERATTSASATSSRARPALIRSTTDRAPRLSLIPVPLSLERLTDRGYNQAAIIARAMAVELDWRYEPNRLRRIRDTGRQSALGRTEREVNVRGAFACRGRLDGRHIALVDDVMTTGATLDAAAQALRAAGAQRVTVFVVARTSANRRPAHDHV